MKKVLSLILLSLLIFLFGCEEEKKMYETALYEDKIEFPFEEIDNGKFINIFRNYHEDSVSLSVVLLDSELLPNSQNLDYCEGITAIRNGKQVLEWIIINFNISFVPENQVENQNDHPGLISYNLPKGTYLVMLNDSEDCNKNNYAIFDVKSNNDVSMKWKRLLWFMN